jgi:hypothetical protein
VGDLVSIIICQFIAKSSVADPDPGVENRCLFDHWIRDPGKVSGSKIPDPQAILKQFLATKKVRHKIFPLFFGVLDPGFEIRDPGWKKS